VSRPRTLTGLIEAFHGDAADAQEALDLVLETFAELGVIILLFSVGLDTRFSELLGVGKRAGLVGALGVVLPFAFGYGVMMLLGEGTTESLFVAVALVATRVGITARVLRDLGVLDSKEARIILGAAVIDDILAMVLLATVSGLGTEGEFDPLDVGLTAGQAIGFTIFIVLIGTRVIGGRFHVYLRKLHISHAPLMVALALMLGLATLAAKVGLAPIIGAFLTGMVLAESAERHELERAAQPIYEFLVPFFFVIVGTRVDPALFFDGSILGLALILTAVAIAGKLLGGGVGGLGMGLRSMGVIGTGMVPRGEVGLIVASLGLSLGVISTQLFSVVVVVSILTTLVVPPALTWLCRPQQARQLAAGKEQMGTSGRLRNM
jgi:Kef-type K+ transport system membrane component KefB